MLLMCAERKTVSSEELGEVWADQPNPGDGEEGLASESLVRSIEFI